MVSCERRLFPLIGILGMYNHSFVGMKKTLKYNKINVAQEVTENGSILIQYMHCSMPLKLMTYFKIKNPDFLGWFKRKSN